MSALSLIIFLATLGVLAVRTRTALTYYQQEDYNPARFRLTALRVGLVDILSSLAVIAFWFAGFSLAAALVFLVTMALILRREWTQKFKKPLVLTERAQRIYGLALAMSAALALVIFVHPLLAVLVLQLAPVMLVVADRLLAPLQKRVNGAFVEEAKEKIAAHPGVRIGITGSFGKTSVKHILAHMLQRRFRVFFSKGSINTVLGITRHVRERLQSGHEVLIFEMGAYGIGSIRRLCEFADPDHAIVTAVGDAHAERFGSIDATAIAKSELPAWVLPKGGKAVFPAQLLQFKPFAELREKYPDACILVSEGGDGDYRVNDIKPTGEGYRFTLSSGKFALEPVEITIPLLGAHNVMNAALSLVLTHSVFGEISFARIAAQSLVPAQHRLDVSRNPDRATIIDDAYNSNENGFKGALEALGEVADAQGGRRILVTPGLAELGDKHESVHRSLGEIAGERADLICVVNPERIPTFIDGARRGSAEVRLFDTFGEAREFYLSRSTPKDAVLIENDLPDILEQEFRIH